MADIENSPNSGGPEPVTSLCLFFALELRMKVVLSLKSRFRMRGNSNWKASVSQSISWCHSATPRPSIFCAQPCFLKAAPLFPRMDPMMVGQVPLIGVLIPKLPQQFENQFEETPRPFHNSSTPKRDKTKGASLMRASRVPRRIPTQVRTESTRTVETRIRKRAQAAASSRALNIKVCVSPTLATGT